MTKLTTEQQTILSFHNYMNCDCQLSEEMFLVAWDEFKLHPLEKMSTEYIKQATDNLDKKLFVQGMDRKGVELQIRKPKLPEPPKARTITSEG